MIFFFGAVTAFFFDLLLLSKKNKTLSDKLLAVWMMFLGINLLVFYLVYSGLDINYPILVGIGFPIPFIHGPLLFLYTASLTGKIKRWNNLNLLHFIPVVLFYVFHFNFFMATSAEKIAFIEQNKSGEPTLFFKLLFPFLIVAALVYLVLTFRLFWWHKDNLKKTFSYSNEKINLHWLRNLIVGLMLVWLVVIIASSFFEGVKSDNSIYLSVVLFVVSIGFMGIRQGHIFSSTSTVNIDKNSLSIRTEQKRYSKSGLKDEDALEIIVKIEKLMNDEKLFLNESLSLVKIADQLQLSPNYLSQVINERFQKNFYDFINTYRIEEFKRIVNNPAKQKYTILALAFECGFNSKSSFNKYFKKTMDCTPSEYLKTLA